MKHNDSISLLIHTYRRVGGGTYLDTRKSPSRFFFFVCVWGGGGEGRRACATEKCFEQKKTADRGDIIIIIIIDNKYYVVHYGNGDGKIRERHTPELSRYFVSMLGMRTIKKKKKKKKGE